jgi:hypothetical protein
LFVLNEAEFIEKVRSATELQQESETWGKRVAEIVGMIK